MAEIPDYDLLDIIKDRCNTAIQLATNYMASGDKAGVKFDLMEQIKQAHDFADDLKGTE